MTATLAELTCTPCRGGVPPLDIDAARHYLAQVADWKLRDDGRAIERTFWFSDFRGALDFVHQVGELAETERHHPEIAFGWGHATITLQTKKIKGLHQNDFIMAARIDRLAQAAGAQEYRGQRPRLSGSQTANGAQETNHPGGVGLSQQTVGGD
jgi:4a-hydroxytetrahydrobiopterin dehydratase